MSSDICTLGCTSSVFYYRSFYLMFTLVRLLACISRIVSVPLYPTIVTTYSPLLFFIKFFVCSFSLSKRFLQSLFIFHPANVYFVVLCGTYRLHRCFFNSFLPFCLYTSLQVHVLRIYCSYKSHFSCVLSFTSPLSVPTVQFFTFHLFTFFCALVYVHTYVFLLLLSLAYVVSVLVCYMFVSSLFVPCLPVLSVSPLN